MIIKNIIKSMNDSALIHGYMMIKIMTNTLGIVKSKLENPQNRKVMGDRTGYFSRQRESNNVI